MRKVITVICFCICSLILSAQVAINTRNMGSGTIMYIDSKKNNPLTGEVISPQLDDDVSISTDGKLGIGTIANMKLDIKTSEGNGFRLKDGNERAGWILTSDATGKATWKKPLVDEHFTASFAGNSGIRLPVTQTGWLSTGLTIRLSPGKWIVFVCILIHNVAPAGGDNDMAFIRSTFGDGVISANNTAGGSSDFISGSLVSGLVFKNVAFSMLTGEVIISNTSGADKNYTYLVGKVDNIGNDVSTVFGGYPDYGLGIASSYWAENNITAFKYEY